MLRAATLRLPCQLLLLTGLLFSSGCHENRLPAATAQTRFVKTELYFGLSRPNGGSVTGEQWDDFLAKTLTPAFPGGLTVLDAHGQWREQSGAIAREASKLVILIHEPTPETGRRIAEIIKAYKARFHQESVLRVTQAVNAAFE